MVIYIHTQVLDGQRKIISLLQEQIENVCVWTKHFCFIEYSYKDCDLCVDGYSSVIFHHQEGKDKKFLITSLQAIHEKRQYPLSPSSRPQPQGSEVSDPDCAVFISVRNRKMFSNRKGSPGRPSLFVRFLLFGT